MKMHRPCLWLSLALAAGIIAGDRTFLPFAGWLFLFGLAGVISVPETGGALFGAFMTNRFSDWFHLVAGAIVFFGSFHDKDDPHTSASGMKF